MSSKPFKNRISDERLSEIIADAKIGAASHVRLIHESALDTLFLASELQEFRAAAPLKAAPAAITDEMVERACRSFIGQWEGYQPEVQRDCRKDMHAALTAALASKPEGER